jgi:hypothetical protein
VPEVPEDATRYRFCPHCGTEAVPDAPYCGGCGNSLAVTPVNAETLTTPETEPSHIDSIPLVDPDTRATPSPINQQASGAKKKNKMKIGIVAVLVIVLGAAIAIVASHGSPRGPSLSQSSGSPAGSNTPEQQFASDVQDQIPAMRRAVQDGQVSVPHLVTIGDWGCSFIAQNPENVEPYQLYGNILQYAVEGQFETGHGAIITVPLSKANGETLASTLITDICPNFRSVIPYGDPGAP